MQRLIRRLLWRFRLHQLIPRLGTVTRDRQVPDYAAFLRDMRDR